eukprot:augustus_masked-scaffold_3-processed-gene-6.73-mRNA-1 protein AED:1.00 eAED:1.00 QI:0/-1/0/0/-1/1/1/0/564
MNEKLTCTVNQSFPRPTPSKFHKSSKKRSNFFKCVISRSLCGRRRSASVSTTTLASDNSRTADQVSQEVQLQLTKTFIQVMGSEESCLELEKISYKRNERTLTLFQREQKKFSFDFHDAKQAENFTKNLEKAQKHLIRYLQAEKEFKPTELRFLSVSRTEICSVSEGKTEGFSIRIPLWKKLTEFSFHLYFSSGRNKHLKSNVENRKLSLDGNSLVYSLTKRRRVRPIIEEQTILNFISVLPVFYFSYFFGFCLSILLCLLCLKQEFLFSFTVHSVTKKRNESIEEEKRVIVEKLEGIDALRAAFDPSLPRRIDDLPQNWLEGTDYIREKALQCWNDSITWRRGQKIDELLNKPQPKFHTIKKIWPHSFLSTENGYLVTYEKFSHLSNVCHNLHKAKVSPDEFSDHCTFLNEYWINKLVKQRSAGELKDKMSLEEKYTSGPYKGKIIKIMDVGHLEVGVTGIRQIIKYFGHMNKAMQQYPEILERSYFVNVDKAGTIFQMLFSLLPKFLEERTMGKIKQVKDYEELKDLVDVKYLPSYLGGDWTKSLSELPIEKEIGSYVNTLS